VPDKHPSVESVLARLERDLRAEFTVVDHWPDDLCAIGVARRDDPATLVYISTYPPEEGKLAYECERASTEPDQPYRSEGVVEDATYEQLVRAVREHLDMTGTS
jgi:hypothetical protein